MVAVNVIWSPLRGIGRRPPVPHAAGCCYCERSCLVEKNLVTVCGVRDIGYRRKRAECQAFNMLDLLCVMEYTVRLKDACALELFKGMVKDYGVCVYGYAFALGICVCYCP